VPLYVHTQTTTQLKAPSDPPAAHIRSPKQSPRPMRRWVGVQTCIHLSHTLSMHSHTLTPTHITHIHMHSPTNIVANLHTGINPPTSMVLSPWNCHTGAGITTRTSVSPSHRLPHTTMVRVVHVYMFVYVCEYVCKCM
jgi:hypothetical protein